MPEISSSMHVIAVKDLRVSCRFYEQVMGFSVHEIGDDGWRILVKDKCRIMAGHCPDAMAAQATGDHSYFAYFHVEDIEAYFDEIAMSITPSGGKIIKPLRDEPWGMREFAVQTADGHRIMVGCEI